MKLLFTIAWRNIQRHKGKSFVIGIIIFLGALIMTVGNGVITGMNNGLKDNIIDRFTGEVVIISKNQEDPSVIFTTMGIMSKEVELIPNYFAVKEVLDKQHYIDQYIPICRGSTFVLSDEGDMGWALLLGVDFEKYQKMFKNNIILLDGQYLKGDERGILVTEDRRNAMYDEQYFWVKPIGYPLKKESLSEDAKKEGDNLVVREKIVIMGSGIGTLDIRTDVKGIIKYGHLNNYWKFFNIIDVESFRESFGFLTGTDAEVKLTGEKAKIMSKDKLDDMFGEDMVVETDSKEREYDIHSLVGGDKNKKKTEIDSGAYNIIFVKLKDINTIDESVKKLNSAFSETNAGARAITWKQAIGSMGDMANLVRTTLYVFVILIFLVAAIIIMNTLSMAAMERVTEVGMMRAVGAQKLFIGNMFFIESSILSGIFGGIGIVVGILLVIVLNAFNFTTTNDLLQLVFGGSEFRPTVDIMSILVGIIELVLVTIISTIYPIRVARKIVPLDAISRE